MAETALSAALEAANSSRSFTGVAPSDDAKEDAEVVDEKVEVKEETSEEETTEETTEKAEVKESEVKFKYSSHEEAEKGYKEAERKMHEALAEADTYKNQIGELQEKVKSSAKAEGMTKAEVKELNTVFESMLTEINSLDSDSETYTKDLAKIWAKGVGSALDEYDKARDEKEQKIRQGREAEDNKKISIEDARAKVIKSANEAATKAGLDMAVVNDEPSVDYELFWNLSAQAQGKTVEDRINWTVNEVKRIKSAITGKRDVSTEKAKANQIKNKVLEKGIGAITDKKKDTEPISLTDALRRTERRL